MLVVHADAQVVVALDQPVQRLQLARHELEQRRLPRAVGAHDGDAAVEVHAQVHAAAWCDVKAGRWRVM